MSAKGRQRKRGDEKGKGDFMNGKEMVKVIYDALADKKAGDIKVIDIQNVSVISDYFIIADGANKNQVQAMADNVEEAMEKAGCRVKQIEGYQTANWILMDFNDVIVHIFSSEDRLFYDLERIWRDGKNVELAGL